MSKTIAILGRQPAIGIAELESLYGADCLTKYSDKAVLLDKNVEEIDFNRLGGSIRLAKVLTKINSNKWSDIEKYLLDTTPEHAKLVKGKLNFGISAYGVKATPKDIAKTALLVKNEVKNSGQSVRMVPHKELSLGSAVVIHNKLTSKNGWELLVICDGQTTILAQTVKIQDIEAYTARDQARPFRDAKVGMLPPKLAQIIINLAVGRLSDNSSTKTQKLLDPFCGTGVVLQEALLMKYLAFGTDIEPRMIDYSMKNLEWLNKNQHDINTEYSVEIGNATTHKWNNEIDFVAGESFLGHPLSKLPDGEHLSKIIYEANVINHRFLQNLAGQIETGFRLCLAVPVWRGKHEFLHLPLLDHLTEMGYTRIRFKHASNEDLIYHRDNQVVGRELLVLEKS